MKQNAQTLEKEHEIIRERIKDLISQLYRQHSTGTHGKETSDLVLLDEWEYEGQVFNAITEKGLATNINDRVEELFAWDDLETESLIEIARVLEDKEFVTAPQAS